MSLTQRLTLCDTAVRKHLEPGERVLAVGRCEDITEVHGPERGGTASAYVMITTQRLRRVPDERFPLECRVHLRAKGHLRGDGRSPLSRTELAFSRRDTQAAGALRKALNARLSS